MPRAYNRRRNGSGKFPPHGYRRLHKVLRPRGPSMIASHSVATVARPWRSAFVLCALLFWRPNVARFAIALPSRGCRSRRRSASAGSSGRHAHRVTRSTLDRAVEDKRPPNQPKPSMPRFPSTRRSRPRFQACPTRRLMCRSAARDGRPCPVRARTRPRSRVTPKRDFTATPISTRPADCLKTMGPTRSALPWSRPATAEGQESRYPKPSTTIR